ncbi:MAG: CBS domain-containing protein [Parvibaculaceae bacterium]
MSRCVQDILNETNRAVEWIGPLESVFDALEQMNSRNVGALLVQIDGYLVGILSERDYVRKVILDHRASKTTKVSEIMTRDVITVQRQDSVLDCIELMRQHNFRHLPVVEKGQAVGVVSLRDLFVDVLAHGQQPASVVSLS